MCNRQRSAPLADSSNAQRDGPCTPTPAKQGLDFSEGSTAKKQRLQSAFKTREKVQS